MFDKIRVSSLAVTLGVALLAAMAADLENGHALYTDLMERLFHRVQLGVLDDGFDLRHGFS